MVKLASMSEFGGVDELIVISVGVDWCRILITCPWMKICFLVDTTGEVALVDTSKKWSSF